MALTRLFLVAPLVGAILAAMPAPTRAGSFVTGDSLGQGIAAAAGLPNRARLSVQLSNRVAIDQINALPRGSVAFMSLGTNDAVGPVARLGPAVDRIVAAAQRRGVRLVWIGPPCVLSRRVRNAPQLDALLRERVRGEGVVYVSTIAGVHCTAAMRARDGIHFTPRGYRALWDLARAANEAPAEPAVAEPAVAEPAATASLPIAQAPPPALAEPATTASLPIAQAPAPAAPAVETVAVAAPAVAAAAEAVPPQAAAPAEQPPVQQVAAAAPVAPAAAPPPAAAEVPAPRARRRERVREPRTVQARPAVQARAERARVQPIATAAPPAATVEATPAPGARGRRERVREPRAAQARPAVRQRRQARPAPAVARPVEPPPASPSFWPFFRS